MSTKLGLDGVKGNTSSKTAQLVELLCELGPDVPEISRRLGQFKESVRYRYNEKILGRGFAVQAAVDHERIGLRRLVTVLDFAKEFEPFAPAILEAMNDLCYLTSYSKTLPEGHYIVNLSAPTQSVDEIRRFFMRMRDRGMFSRLEILDFEWFRRIPMRAELYDFDTGIWDFDFSEGRMGEFNSASFVPSAPTKFDYMDLLIVKELQKDANKSLKEISQSLEFDYKKLVWHYNTHVLGRGLIRGYSVNWMGTKYDTNIERALNRKHTYYALQLLVRNVTGSEMMRIRQKIDSLPFLWSEAAGKNYSAELTFPVDHIVEGLQYIAHTMEDFRERIEVYTVDQSAALSFTVPYALFDKETKKWKFDGDALAARFEELVVRIKGGSS